MYKVKTIYNDEDILLFEQMRTKSFNTGENIKTLNQSPYAKDIKEMNLVALMCSDENENAVGGALIGVKKNNLFIHYLFVNKENRHKKIGSVILNFIARKKQMFEDFFFEDFNSIVAEPLFGCEDFYYKNGFDSYRTVMYKKIKKNN